MYIIVAIIVFGLLIATHELGHFIAAKACGVKVVEFSIGMGPAVYKKQGKETLYSLRALPVGGFCAMEGEDSKSNDPRAFTNQVAWKRIIILVAGSAMNFLLGFVLILLVFSQAESFTTPTITGFMEDCPYEGEDGLMAGDTIYKIDGERIYFSSNVGFYLGRGNGKTVDLVLIRDGKKIYLDDYPMTLREYEQGGETVLKYGLYFGVKETGAAARLKYSWYCVLDFVRLVRLGLVDLVTGVVGIRDMSGPVGIVGLINDVGQGSENVSDAISNIAYFTAFITVNLSVMNMLPIPALDGGRVLFLVVTWVTERVLRRKIDPKYEGYIHAAGLFLLFGLMAVVMFNDIVKIIAA
ncbi:MAG TPA: site-2 protease family protein [Clostridiales bacterium]|nr:site-2 protease family protein [Clostridiales bacterium]